MKKILLGCPQCKKEALKDKCHHQLCWPDMSKYCETLHDYENWPLDPDLEEIGLRNGPYGDVCSRQHEGEDKDYCAFDLPQPIPLCPYCETEIKEIQKDINKGIGKCPHCSKHIKFSECSCDDNNDSEQSPDDDSWSYVDFNFFAFACECIVEAIEEYDEIKDLTEQTKNDELVYDLEDSSTR